MFYSDDYFLRNNRLYPWGLVDRVYDESLEHDHLEKLKTDATEVEGENDYFNIYRVIVDFRFFIV